MAELVNLHQADKHLKRAYEELTKVSESLSKGIASKEQAAVLSPMYEAMRQLYACMTEIMHNNRDGRGTAGKK